ncbi:MAG: hypothetical protein WAM71_04665, partial [Candidatus Korobacteraceae bacterium]
MNRKIPLVVLCLLFSRLASGQQAKQVIEPEYLSVFYSVDSSGQLHDLERQTATQKASGFKGFGGNISYVVNGTQSPIRFAAGAETKFVVGAD